MNHCASNGYCSDAKDCLFNECGEGGCMLEMATTNSKIMKKTMNIEEEIDKINDKLEKVLAWLKKNA